MLKGPSKISPESLVLQAEPSQDPQIFFPAKVFKTSGSLQQVHIFPVLDSRAGHSTPYGISQEPSRGFLLSYLLGREVRYDILFNLPFLVNVLMKVLLIILSKLSSSCALAFLISSPCV